MAKDPTVRKSRGPRQEGARSRLRRFFERHVGSVLHADELRQVAGISEWARRVRELRDLEGMQIRTNTDRADLKPGEYVLETLERTPVIGAAVSARVRNEILERNGFMCVLCGAIPADPDPYHPGRAIRLHVDHIVPLTQDGSNEPENLRTLCTNCNLGRASIQAPTETALNVIRRLRRAGRDVRREVLEHLQREFAE